MTAELQEPLACWEKQLLTGDEFLCALPTGHDGDCQPYADETTVFGFDLSRDGEMVLVQAATGRWIPIGFAAAVPIRFIDPPAPSEPVTDLALWERARSVTFPDFDARPLLERIGTLLDDVVDPEIGPDAARWTPDDGATW